MVRLTANELRRREVKERLENCYDGCRYLIADLVEKYGIECLYIEFNEGYYDDPSELTIVRYREENEAEYDARLKQLRAEKSARAKQKRDREKALHDAEFAEFLRLKDKFGGA